MSIDSQWGSAVEVKEQEGAVVIEKDEVGQIPLAGDRKKWWKQELP